MDLSVEPSGDSIGEREIEGEEPVTIFAEKMNFSGSVFPVSISNVGMTSRENEIFFVGGSQNYLADSVGEHKVTREFLSFNTETNEFHRLPDVNVERCWSGTRIFQHPQTKKTMLFSFGGENNKKEFSKETIQFDFENGKWEVIGKSPWEKEQHLILLECELMSLRLPLTLRLNVLSPPNDYMVVIGSPGTMEEAFRLHFYDFEKESWFENTFLNKKLNRDCKNLEKCKCRKENSGYCISLSEKCFYFIRGEPKDEKKECPNTVQTIKVSLDPMEFQVLEVTGQLPNTFGGHPVLFNEERNIIFWGGFVLTMYPNRRKISFYVFDIAKKKWKKYFAASDQSFILTRIFRSVVCCGDHLYVYGGESEKGGDKNGAVFNFDGVFTADGIQRYSDMFRIGLRQLVSLDYENMMKDRDERISYLQDVLFENADDWINEKVKMMRIKIPGSSFELSWFSTIT